MAKRLDSMGVEVQVGDIVLSCPKSKWSHSVPEVGQVSGVFDSGRVTIKVPSKVSIYAYERGAPDKEKEGFQYVPDPDAEVDAYGRRGYAPYIRRTYTYMQKDYTIVGTEWRWVKKQAADITLIVLKRGSEDFQDLQKAAGITDLVRNLNLDYDVATPALD